MKGHTVKTCDARLSSGLKTIKKDSVYPLFEHNSGVTSAMALIKGISVETMLDSGSTISLLHRSMLPQLGISEATLIPSKLSLRGIGGSAACPIGEVDLPVSFAGCDKTVKCRFVVGNWELPRKVVFGVPALKQLGIMVDWKKGKGCTRLGVNFPVRTTQGER
jgi:hypothetical protein